MPIAFKCPKCGKPFKVKDELAGKVAGCPCGAKFKIPTPKPKVAPTPPPPPPPLPVEDEPVEDFAPSEPEDDFMADQSEDDFDASEPEEDFTADEPADEPSDDDTGVFDEDDATDDEAPVEDEPAASDEDSVEEPEEEAEMVTPKSIAGRLLLVIGLGALIACLVLPWVEPGAVDAKAPAAATDDAADAEADADAEKDVADEGATDADELRMVERKVTSYRITADGVIAAEDVDATEEAPKAEEEAVVDDAEKETIENSEDKDDSSADAAMAGYAYILENGSKSPMMYGVFAATVLALVFFVLAVLGKGGFIVGLVMTALVPVAALVGLVGIVQALYPEGELIASITTMFEGNALVGVLSLLVGAVACLAGGVLCALGCMSGPRPANGGKAAKPARGGRGGRRGAKNDDADEKPARGGRRAGGAAKPAMPAKKPGGMKPPFAKKKVGKKAGKKVSKKINMKPRKKK